MQSTLRASVIVAFGLLMTSPSWAVTISINTLIPSNPSFESGQSPWLFTGSSQGIYTPAPAQYAAGAPDGTHVAAIPFQTGTTGFIERDLSAIFQANTDYSLTFYVGTPNGFTTPSTVQAYLLQCPNPCGGQYTTDNIANDPKAITGIQVGSFTQVTVTWTAADIANGGNAGHFIGFAFRAAGSGNGLEVDFDLATPTQGSGQGTTPLPATLPLFAGGLGAIGLLGWRRKRKAAAAV